MMPNTEIDFQNLRTTGVKINYLYVCERKLWLFDRGISMESGSDKVLMGKLLGEYSYPREGTKEILIDNLINIDIVGNDYMKARASVIQYHQENINGGSRKRRHAYAYNSI
jgi:CRISPR-associated exonuclease Cas4